MIARKDERSNLKSEQAENETASAEHRETLDTAQALRDFYAKIPIAHGLPYGIQHVLAMFVANLAPIFIVAAAAGMDSVQSAALIQNALLMAGLGTLIQLFPLWRVGGALPIVTGISFTYVSAVVAIVAASGYNVAVGAIIVGGLVEGVLGLTVRFWRRFVPPVVSAVVVTTIGFSLLSVGAESFGGGSGAEDFGSWQNLLLACISLVSCLAFQALAKGTKKQLSVLFGLVVGYAFAVVIDKVDFSAFAGLAPISVPHVLPFAPEFDLGAIISIALLYLVSSVEVMGNTTALTKVGFDRVPTDRELSGAITADGLVSSVAGVFGCLPITSFAQNVGLVAMTRVVNRRVIACGGVLLILAAFVPAVAAVFNSLPEAVLGGCTIIMFGNIALSGFQMLAEAGFTQRNVTIAALAIAVGVGFTQVPQIFAAFPPIVQSIFASNSIAVAFVVACVANFLLPKDAGDEAE
ncbi:nucleobase:cation symporter-2 family protein [uncultured Enorma sp.]|uniref:nucleobase:cation symporter-2 family protein n=1 Tax=uncultured Enorma sp. TaxID=1714346 RepID=UPI00280495E2|nr:nucleobase:cation symporter-2 family protein [uncultured Enorma sp.]